jgi:hypothetical protein
MKNRLLNREMNEELLHEQARDLMAEINRKYYRDTELSLDEYVLEVELTEDEKFLCYELINKFAQL